MLNVFILNSKIENNAAANGNGGGIYFYCYPDSTILCNLTLVSTTISSNRAHIGGGIKWNYNEPVNTSCTITENTATLYGNNFASFS